MDFTIMMIGSAGMASALDILDSKEDELKQRYPLSYLQKAKVRLTEERDRIEAFSESLGDSWGGTNEDRTWLCPIRSEGVFGALWIMGDILMRGLRVNQDDIPIDQAVIELCDYVDINPYEADGTGSYLIATLSPGRVLDVLEQNGIVAKVIGYCNSGNARIIKGATERYLNKPAGYKYIPDTLDEC